MASERGCIPTVTELLVVAREPSVLMMNSLNELEP